jgi:hypothetical protein
MPHKFSNGYNELYNQFYKDLLFMQGSHFKLRSVVTNEPFKLRTNGVRSLAKAKDFSSSLCIQTSSEAHPTSYPVGTGNPFLGLKGGAAGM